MNVALQAFGTAEKVGDVQRWFAERRAQQFAKAEERLHRRCGAVTQGVLHDVERLLRQTRGIWAINGQCTIANLKTILGNHGLTNSGSKAELVQRVHNNINSIREALGLQPDDAVDVEEHVQGDAESDDGDEGELVCFVCLQGDVSEGDDILICDGPHSHTHGCHQKCCNPPLEHVPEGPWFCADCEGEGSAAPDPEYVPSIAHSSNTAQSSSSSSSSRSRSSSTSVSDEASDSDSDSSVSSFSSASE